MAVLTVTQLNRYAAFQLKEDRHLQHLLIRGEISGFTRNQRSGHCYFILKDAESSVRAVLFRNQASRISIPLANGISVIAAATATLYEREGTFQLCVTDLQMDGVGAQQSALEQRKRRLAALGVFDAARKRPLPAFPKKIGVVTSASGAAIHDIEQVIRRRFPLVQVMLFPAQVQGDSAPESISHAIQRASQSDCDVLIVGRGGGSAEDLQAFQTEEVVMAVFRCPIPVISAVGHEIDQTLTDYAADLRAPTPSAAAELAVFDYMEFENKLQNYRKMLTTYEEHFIEKYKLLTKNLENSIQMYSPKNMLLTRKQYISDLQMHLTDCFHTILDSRKHMLQIYAVRLNGLSPLNKISKGFAYVANDSGESIKTVEQLKKGDNINLTISDGKIKASVLEVQGENNGE